MDQLDIIEAEGHSASRFISIHTQNEPDFEMHKAVAARVPTRTDADDRYFGDSFQNMPLHGYTRMFEAMLDHPNITVRLNTDFREIANDVRYDRLIFTGPIDEFFDLSTWIAAIIGSVILLVIFQAVAKRS